MTGQRECSNCGAILEERYCPSCGQDGTRGLLTLGAFLRRLLAELLDLDGSLLRTLRGILTKPGQMARDYSDGKMRSQFSPARLYLASAALYFVIAPFLGDGSIRIEGPNGSFEDATVTPLRWDTELLLLTLVPSWAVAVQMLLLGKGRYFEESFVFSVHFHVFYLVLLLALGAILAAVEALALRGAALAASATVLLVPLPYMWIALGRAFDLRPIRRTVSSLLLFITHLLLGLMLFDLLSGTWGSS